jgi:hypothetical protein
MSADLIPEVVLSASPCICDFFPAEWAIDWTSARPEERTIRAAAFRIFSADLPRVTSWATGALLEDFGWPGTFYSLDGAQRARATFLLDDLQTVIFGLGLHASALDDFVTAAKPPDRMPSHAPLAGTGVYECVSSGRPIADGGNALGFELLSTYSGMLTCSWLCNGLEKDCAANLGVRTNSHGFIANHADASRCAEYVGRDDVGAEPGLWLPWLVTVYARS